MGDNIPMARDELERGSTVKTPVANEEIEIGKEWRSPIQQPVNDAKVVLGELFELLEGYGPVWYTKDHHDRALAALLAP